MIEDIVNKLKNDTNKASDINYRIKFINNSKIYIIYNESLCSGDTISDFIIRSLDDINKKYKNKIDLLNVIENEIDNFKIKEITKYNDISYYLNSGFTIILIENKDTYLALETKKDLSRSINNPTTEMTTRGPMDSFNENIETNIGLIRRRIKSNNLWIIDKDIGDISKTKCKILYMKDICDKNLVEKISNFLDNININAIINSGSIKNLIEKENKSVFPTVETTERPDIASHSLLNGKIVIVVDNNPYVLILPVTLNDFFKTPEDYYGKSINVTLTRIIRYVSFYISLLTPAIYIAVTTFNHEMLPTEMIINFAAQRESVPFPAFIEALIMILSFEILRESDLRMPSFASSAISIVGALILGEAAVNAGIVSPVMIIVISITAISALSFTEPEIIKGLRWYRILFMLGAVTSGIFGVALAFIIYMFNLSHLNSFGKPYFMPFAPFQKSGFKDSIILFPLKKRNKKKIKEEL